ncbi:bifunctional phosphoribosylaminoimidazolecarboxamide formyltransferase/inosine monophosphate cyclohydrolase [bacterium DOLZORAL124_38_8]|nr:MAG: bifunctional phosphoribosylaminoimidazolecarboxamide formyltransferase/inosine monophosphate cyclohydrolase [bacterium DOLZORAL124_38_8]
MTKRALISVSDKTGVVEFAQELTALGWAILSTGGTFRKLQEAGVPNLQEVAEFTQFPEGLEGRIKTLTPQVFGGILYLRNNDGHKQFMTENKLEDIDMVVVNLYPFKKNYLDDTKTFEQKVEQIDIGGPSMIRAAAKNYEFCAPVVDPSDYAGIIAELKNEGDITLATRKVLAARVFEMTAHYDLLIAKFWVENAEKMPLRYGENPHQSAVVLEDASTEGVDLVKAEVLNGKPLSFNNFGDANGALELAISFDEPFACIIKHASPCCAAIGDTIEEAFERAYKEGDSLSAFGGIIALNRPVNKATAEQIVSFFNEVVIAPAYDDEALEVLKSKKNLRVLKVPNMDNVEQDFTFKRVRGGTLMQDLDLKKITKEDLSVATEKAPTETQIVDLLTAWKIVKLVKSNAIAVVKNGALIGANGGQTSRVDAMQNALRQAGEAAKGAALASDAFFPFPDAVEAAGEAGIGCIIQPGGSRNDDVVFEKCNELNIPTVLTGTRSFLH